MDGLDGKELSKVDDYRFGAMMHEQIWQGVTMHGRLLALGRPDLADSHVLVTARQLSQSPGFRRQWDLNSEGLAAWGYDEFVEAVNKALPDKGSAIRIVEP